MWSYKLTAETKEPTLTTVNTVTPPPVVVTTGKVSLAEKLKLNELPLATTPGGKTFCLKALHPSEHTIKSARVPGGNENSVAICCDMVQTLDISTTDSTVFVIQSANPMIPASVAIAGTNGSGQQVGDYYNFCNAAFGGSVVKNMDPTQVASFYANSFVGKFQKYRVTAQSVTVEHIAPAVSNQGTITACIQPMQPFTASHVSLSNNSFAASPDIWVFPNYGTVDRWLLGTSAYTAKATEGCYQPLKLDKFKWKRTDDPARFYYPNTPGGFPFICQKDAPLYYPYYVDRSAVTSYIGDDIGLKPSSDLGGFIMVQGITANTSVRIRVRQVLEVTGLAGSLYSPMFEAPLPPDELSLKMYKEISARMADAYPASYNDLGTLKNKVLSLGKNLLSFAEPVLAGLQLFPGTVGAVARGVSTATGVARKVIEKVEDSAKKQPPPVPSRATRPPLSGSSKKK